MSRIQLALLSVSVVLAGALLSARGGDTQPAVRPAAAARPVASRPTASPAARAGLSDEHAREAMAFAKQYAPQMYEHLQRLEKENPARFQVMSRRVYQWSREVQQYPEELRPKVIGKYRANLDIYRAVADYRAGTDPAEKARLENRVKELLAERFDNDQAVKEYDLQRLAKQLEALKAEIENRRQRRADIIQDSFRQLLSTTTAPAGGLDKSTKKRPDKDDESDDPPEPGRK